jgi:hypothetical protein
MDALCAAIPVARALLRVADTQGTSALQVGVGPEAALLRVERGLLWDVSGVDGAPLGDTLIACGALDVERHRVALSAGVRHQRVGAWLVQVGAASESAVRAALQLQLVRRVSTVLRLRGQELFLRESRLNEGSGFSVAVPLASAVYVGLLEIARELPDDVLRARAGLSSLRLTRLGHWLEGRLGASAERPLFASLLAKEPVRAQWAERAALRAIGALADERCELDSYSLLLRKRRELISRVSARKLLDLPESAAPERARGAFRKLAQKLHPDRFHAVEPALSAISNEVMRALASAEAELSREVSVKSRSAFR